MKKSFAFHSPWENRKVCAIRRSVPETAPILLREQARVGVALYSKFRSSKKPGKHQGQRGEPVMGDMSESHRAGERTLQSHTPCAQLGWWGSTNNRGTPATVGTEPRNCRHFIPPHLTLSRKKGIQTINPPKKPNTQLVPLCGL